MEKTLLTLGCFYGLSFFRETLSLTSKACLMFKHALSQKTWMVQEHEKSRENCLQHICIYNSDIDIDIYKHTDTHT